MRDEAPLLEILSYELSGVAPSLFHDNGEMRKNANAELMNEISTILTDVLKESAFFHRRLRLAIAFTGQKLVRLKIIIIIIIFTFIHNRKRFF